MISETKNTLIIQKSSWSFLIDYFRVLLYHNITKSALPLFVKGGDVISASPMVVGSHEPHVAVTLEFFAKNGFSDFLLDIGANIGLTSSLVGHAFKRVVLFEPNPLCLGVLETNLAINLIETPYEIKRYGLGRSNERLTLKIPRGNWGGAYISSRDNAYSSETLLAKDGFIVENLQKYLLREIEIRNATEVLEEIFRSFRTEKSLSGSIKIDVEGFEIVVIKAIAEVLPIDMELSIIFEYWEEQLPIEEILLAFDGRAKLYGLIKSPDVKGSRWRKLFSLLFQGSQKYTLVPWRSGLNATDFVLNVVKRLK
jgi:FkbM family methyltransferase